MSNYYLDNEDLKYYIDERIDWDVLLGYLEGNSEENSVYNKTNEANVFQEVFETIGKFVSRKVAPHSRTIDRNRLSLKNGEIIFPEEFNRIFEHAARLGFNGLCLPHKFGGLNGPVILNFISIELFARADTSVAMHYSLTAGMSYMIMLFSEYENTATYANDGTITTTRFDSEIEELLTGITNGCMDITESDCGSDIGAIRTRGFKNGDGDWFISGQKIFVTSGQGKYHFVLARTETEPSVGLAGLSFFICPIFEIDSKGVRVELAKIERIEEKIGIHGSATCVINFDATPARLIGKRGEGFKQMLMLMNNARLGVGFLSIGLCESAYRLAKTYSNERKSMGKTIDQHELIAEMLDEMESDILGLRALAIPGAFHEDMIQVINRKLRQPFNGNLEQKLKLVEKLKQHKLEARKTLPLLKYLASEKALEMARKCVQIHGGAGYTQEYQAEQLLRDAMIFPIYEGTSQIQSLMAMKDSLVISISHPLSLFGQIYIYFWKSKTSLSALKRKIYKLKHLHLKTQRLILIAIFWKRLRNSLSHSINQWPNMLMRSWDIQKDFSFGLLHAERYTRMLCDVAIVDELYFQSKTNKQRTKILERYIERAEVRCRTIFDEVSVLGKRLLSELEVKASKQ